MAEGGLPEPLVISEGDRERGEANTSAEPSWSGESPLKKAEERTREKKEDVEGKMRLEDHQTNTEEDQVGDVFVDVGDKPDKSEQTESVDDGQNRGEIEGETQELIHEMSEKPSQTEDKPVGQNDPQMDITFNLSERGPEGTLSQLEDAKKAHRLTPDFPEALYELLCTFQEGRRLNDQRCSFRLESGIRRRCHSEPNTTQPVKRVIFSSMTSLQREEFFELVATAQARRLDDQRAQLAGSSPPKSKARSFRGSIKHLSFVRKPEKPAPVPVPKEDLYNMILTTQAQGRLEDQRSRAPGPMDDEDFFSLLLRVQGGRMDEQRTELPCMLQT
ncbi:uncharacterized protein gpsm3 isoform 1-T2 [Aulostomus maculatus]